jgi:tetratricopeptide (TPR) repeat protein
MSLVRKEFLRPDRSLFPGDDGFRFNHMLIRDAAYEAMPKQLRAELHERYAQWLEQRGSADEYDEILAYHLEQSYAARAALGQADSHAETVAARAGLLLARAGRRALSRGESRAAAGQLNRAATLLAVDPVARVEVLPDYGLALLEAGDMAGAERVLDEAIEQARRAGDARSELRAEVDRAWILFLRGADGWDEQARHVAERAIAVFAELGDDGNLAGAWTLLGWVEGQAGRGEARIAALRRARAHARAAGDRRREMEIWVGLGGAMISARTPADELLAFGDEELAWARDHGVPFLEADASLLGVYVYPMLGRFDEARDLLARARAIFEEHGAAENTAETFWVGGQVELLASDFAAAEREFRRRCA